MVLVEQKAAAAANVIAIERYQSRRYLQRNGFAACRRAANLRWVAKSGELAGDTCAADQMSPDQSPVCSLTEPDPTDLLQ